MQNIDYVRQLMLTTIEQLLDKKEPLEVERGKAIARVGDVLISSAKVEIDFIRVTDGTGSGFIPNRPIPELADKTNGVRQ